MADRTETFDQVAKIIADKLKIEKNLIAEESTLQQLGADSLDVVEIIMKLEEQFDVEVDDDKAEELKNVKDVVDYIQSLRS